MKFINFEDPSIRYTGRFGKYTNWSGNYMAATACGATIEIAFKGRDCVLLFNTNNAAEPFAHLYISVDGGARVESVLSRFVRVSTNDDGEHHLVCIFKSDVENQHRWFIPLVGCVAFEGYEAEDSGVLPEDTRKTIEIVGDSITEGVLIDAFRKVYVNDGQNRPWQDDVTATYGWLTAEALNLRPFMMGYGAVGLTRSGSGHVPKVAESYPYNYEGSPATYPSCDYIMINHGANDRGNRDAYLPEYEKLLKLIRSRNPQSKIIILSPFCGAFDDILPEFVNNFNVANGDNVNYISSHGWVPAEPLHPLRDGHKIIAEHLVEELGKIL